MRITFLCRLLIIGILPFLLMSNSHSSVLDSNQVLGVENCAECHEKENEVWAKTKHATSLKEISRHEKSKALKKLLGTKRVTREENCVRCHFTNAYIAKKRNLPGAEPAKPKLKTIEAVSCEFCHGEAKEWGPVHGDYGGKKITKKMETSEHRRQRLEKMKKFSIVGRNNLYAMTKRCFSCHITDDEKIVNSKEHPILSKDFEMVAWSQGDMRHNLWFSDGKENVLAPIEKQRLYYILSKTVSLEMFLRALAKSDVKGLYSESFEQQIGKVKQELATIVDLGGPTEITATNKITIDNATPSDLLRFADDVAKLSKNIEAKYDGKKLSSIDSLLPKQKNYKRLEK